MKNISGILKTIGPGILFAGAAIGGSHLIQSTRAGADYGYSLFLIVFLANLFKYPFFEFSYRYTSAKGKSLLEGYRDLGSWALWSFLVISIITGVINLAALALGASGLLGYILGIPIEPLILSIGLVLICILILAVGKFPMLDKSMKFMVIMLGIATTIAFIMALSVNTVPVENFAKPDIYAKSGILFLIALMGWMPAPIEASVWTSLWSISRRQQNEYVPTLKESLIDFHIGYIVTTILALFFLTLGAQIMYGTGIGFEESGTGFSKQLIQLYTGLFGKWSAVIIAPAAFITIFSSLLTVIDAYPRSITGAVFLIYKKADNFRINLYIGLILVMSVCGLLIVSLFVNNLKAMMDLATILSFLAAPVFAFINYKIVTSIEFPNEYKPPKWLIILAVFGLIFLISFSLIYLWSLVLM